MPEFKYEALDKMGKKARGRINAANEEAIIQKLREVGYYPARMVPCGKCPARSHRGNCNHSVGKRTAEMPGAHGAGHRTAVPIVSPIAMVQAMRYDVRQWIREGAEILLNMIIHAFKFNCAARCC